MHCAIFQIESLFSLVWYSFILWLIYNPFRSERSSCLQNSHFRFLGDLVQNLFGTFLDLVGTFFKSHIFLFFIVSGKERRQKSPTGTLQLQYQSLHWRLSQADRKNEWEWRGKVCQALRKGDVRRHWQIATRKWLETTKTRKHKIVCKSSWKRNGIACSATHPGSHACGGRGWKLVATTAAAVHDGEKLVKTVRFFIKCPW